MSEKKNLWIEHVKKYAKDNNVSYKEALSKSKASYKPMKGKGILKTIKNKVLPVLGIASTIAGGLIAKNYIDKRDKNPLIDRQQALSESVGDLGKSGSRVVRNIQNKLDPRTKSDKVSDALGRAEKYLGGRGKSKKMKGDGLFDLPRFRQKQINKVS